MTKAQRKKVIPVRKAKADDLAVTIDGEEYFVHEGDWVDFAGGNQTVGDFLSSLEIKGTDLAAASVDDDASRQAGITFSNWLESIAASIVTCHFHDQSGVLLPEHPTANDLRRLDFDELSWMRGGGRQQSTPLAEESPST